MEPFAQDSDFTLWHGEAEEVLSYLPPDSVDMIVTSPPYFNLRDYGVDRQIGLEVTVGAYVARLCSVFAEAKRVLSPAGTLWLNLADSFSRDPRKGQHKPGDSGMQAYVYDRGGGRTSNTNAIDAPAKNLLFVPQRLAIALQDDGWWVRQDVIWEKTNALPESVTDRPSCSHEHLYMLTKSARYFYNAEAVKEPAKWERWGAQTTIKVQPGKASFIKAKSKQELLAEHAVGSSQRRVAGFNGRWDEQEQRRIDLEHRSAIEGGQSLQAEPNGLRNLRSVWSIPTEPNTWAACDDCDAVFQTSAEGQRHEQMSGHTLAPHFAAFPRKLVQTCLLASAPPGGTVLDPFMGSGTTMIVARAMGLRSVGIELREAYCRMIAHRAQQLSFLAELADG